MEKMMIACLTIFMVACVQPSAQEKSTPGEPPSGGTWGAGDIWGDCRYEVVFVPEADAPRTMSDEEAARFLLGNNPIHYPRTILLNQCSGYTWLLREEGWEQMRLLPQAPANPFR